MGQQFDWFVVRSSGLVAWGIVTASVVWGLLLSFRVRRPRRAWTLSLHRFLGALTFVFVAVHLGALALDTYVDFGPREMLVPMASTWRPGAVAWGVVVLYLLVAVELTSLFMARLNRRAWHLVHLGAYVVFAGTTVHALTAGADARHPLVQAYAWGASAVVLLLTGIRLVAGVRTARRRAARDEANGPAPVPSPARSLREVENAIAGVVRGAAAARALESAERRLVAPAQRDPR